MTQPAHESEDASGRARDSSHLFVYGTLRRGFSRHGNLRRLGARFVGRGSVRGELFDLGDFPALRESDNPGRMVLGEVYRFRNPRRAFKVLDEVEGFRPAAPSSGLLRREVASITFDNGTRVAAWAYWLNRAFRSGRAIPSGDYTRR